jgi:subtilisin family serine protease
MHSWRRLAGLAAVFLISCGSLDENREKLADDSTLISLHSITVDTRVAAPVIPDNLRADPSDAAAQQYVLVKFPGPIKAEQERALRAAAAKIYTYLPYYSYLVKMPSGQPRAALSSMGAVFSGPYHPLYKISRGVAAIRADEASYSERAKQSVMVQIYPDADVLRVAETIRALGIGDIVGKQESSFFSRIRLLLTPAEIAAIREPLARIPEVFWIDTEPRKALLNDTTIWVGQSGLNGNMATPVFDHGIYGEGQVVAIVDTGIDPDMCYFRDPSSGPPPRNECDGGTAVDLAQRKVIAVNFLDAGECAGGITGDEWDTQDHGSHVAGTVGGDDFAKIFIHNAGDGMAPGAKLVIQDGGYAVDECGDLPGIGCPVVDLKPIFQQAYDQGARIHTNSWGDQENNPSQNNYTTACQDVDEFMWDHKDFILVFAAGNSGPAAGSVGSPATAKSTLSVGATQRGSSANSTAGFSSCGPTDDGRLKPDVMIPGQGIVSANSDNDASSNNCNTRTMSGTSMAAPGAAGLLALIRQYYMDGFYPSGIASAPDGFTPTAALLRATLVNSTQALNNNVMPSNCHGWGRILLDNALYFASEERRLSVVDDAAGFATGSVNEAQTLTFTVHPSAATFKATLAWTDYPSTPAANPHINNDLDLEVVGPGGTYFGNVFNAGESILGGSPDRKNTLEQVFMKSPAPGEYTVTVRSFNVPNGPQPFALVVSGAASKAGTPGATCGAAAECLSGFCVDGVCCDAACDAGACDACSKPAGAAVNGTCSLLTGEACDDADACTQVDTCQAGVCSGASPVVCAAPGACHDEGTCDPATGVCSAPAKDDNTTCDDGSACTGIDTCQGGVCTGANPVVCPAPDECHELGVCDATTGLCSNPVKMDGSTCDDGDACTGGDSCQAGVCITGSPVVCAALDECHEAGTCDTTTGCSNPAKEDGTPCSAGVCAGGVCGASSSSSGGSSGGLDLGEEGGCGCRVASPRQSGVAAVGIGLGLLLALRRRRRSRC